LNSTGSYLTVKMINLAAKQEKIINPMNYALTLEKSLTEDSVFSLQNKELDPFYQKNSFVFADVFFSLCHQKTSIFFLISFFDCFCIKRTFGGNDAGN